MSGFRPSRAVIGATVVLVLAIGGVAAATIPGSGGVINGCYVSSATAKRPLGTLRVIDTGQGQKCGPNERALTWNEFGQRGPRGLQGLPGPQGKRGPRGAVGPQGPAGSSVVSGMVAADGSVLAGSTFTSTWDSKNTQYVLNFKPGTFTPNSTFPSFVANPIGYEDWPVLNSYESTGPDGSWTVVVEWCYIHFSGPGVSRNCDGKAQFSFIVSQPR